MERRQSFDPLRPADVARGEGALGELLPHARRIHLRRDFHGEIAEPPRGIERPRFAGGAVVLDETHKQPAVAPQHRHVFPAQPLRGERVTKVAILALRLQQFRQPLGEFRVALIPAGGACGQRLQPAPAHVAAELGEAPHMAGHSVCQDQFFCVGRRSAFEHALQGEIIARGDLPSRPRRRRRSHPGRSGG
jgi:hypothetical protein